MTTTTTASGASKPLIYGHRGCRGLRPENTLPAFLHALEWPIDGLELDVIMSADGEVVVSHEPWLNAAICTGPDGALLTAEAGHLFNLFQQPYAAIRRCDCSRPHPNFPEQRTIGPAHKPTLTEVFTAVAARCAELNRRVPAFSIELKSIPGYDGIYQPAPSHFVDQVARVIAAAQSWLLADILLMSFDHRVVQAARATTAYPVCLLIEDPQPIEQHIRQLGFIPDVLGPDYQLLNESLLRFCGEAQLPIITWTVNEAAVMRRVAALGVQGITTDYPDRVQAAFSRQAM